MRRSEIERLRGKVEQKGLTLVPLSLYLKGPRLALRMPGALGAYRQWKLQRAKRKFQVYMRKHGGRGPRVN